MNTYTKPVFRLVNLSFKGMNSFFVLLFEKEPGRRGHAGYYKMETKDYITLYLLGDTFFINQQIMI